jgi:hypothetical protein
METDTINAELQTENWVPAQQNDGTWKPEKEGDVLTGYYESFETTRNGKNLYCILQNDNEIIKVWGGKIIDSFFNHKTGVQIGEKVKITFLGKKPIMNGTIQRINAETGEPMFYNDYEVLHTLGKRKTSKLSPEDQAKTNAEDKKLGEELKAGKTFEEDEVDVKMIPF